MHQYGQDTPIDIDPRYGRSFKSQSAAVTSPSALASVAGYHALAQGGSATDAMVAVNAALNVTYPHMSGAGGDAFWLFYDASTGQTHCLNASGRSGQQATMAAYEGQSRIEQRGPRSCNTVPGAVSGWWQAQQRFGQLDFSTCLQPAIRLARQGFPVTPSLAQYMEQELELLRTYNSTAKTLLKDGVAPYAVGQSMRNPELAATLEAIADGGAAAFYQGETARRIVTALQEHGGLLTLEDMANHQADWVEPVAVNYKGRRVIAPPPNSEGMVTLQVLGMLSQFDASQWHHKPAEFIDVFTRATAMAFRDRDHYLDDPDFFTVPTDTLLDDEYLKERAQAMFKPYLDSPEQGFGSSGDTTFSCAADAQGNIVGVVQSLYWEWGSGFVADGTGLMLQNRGSFFSLDERDHNRLRPHKRPAHTLTCSMALDAQSNKPEAVVGAQGGDGEPQTQALLISRMLDQGYSAQQAVDAPRWLLGQSWGEKFRGLRLEGRYNEELAQALRDRGHNNVTLIEPFSDLVGQAQAIRVAGGIYEAASDPRADGLALGF